MQLQATKLQLVVGHPLYYIVNSAYMWHRIWKWSVNRKQSIIRWRIIKIESILGNDGVLEIGLLDMKNWPEISDVVVSYFIHWD